MGKERIEMNQKTNLSAEDVFALFIKKCKVKNLTALTIRSYEQKIVIFFKFINSKDSITSINSDTIDNYIIYLKENTKANDTTINSYLRCVKAFLYFAMDKQYIKSFKIPLIKADKKIKETYTDEELAILLKRPDMTKCNFTTFKIWVFENYLLATGNRLSTALNVKIGDIDFQNGFITLRKTKSRKQQIIPLSAVLSNILQEYLEVRGGEADDYLFCNEYGEKAIQRTYLQLVQRYNQKRGVSRSSIHCFRHSFARKAIQNGMDAFRLQKMLGHSDLTVTKQYIEMYSTDLQMNFEKFCPLDNMIKSKNVIRM